MKIQLLAFASARDAVGADRLDLDLPEGLDLAGLRAKLEERYPDLAPLWPRLALAVDGEVVPAGTALAEGAEVALLPPVSGGCAAAVTDRVALVDDAIDAAELLTRVSSPAFGAGLLFVGTVRDRFEGRRVTRIDYSAYRPMARTRLVRIVEELEAGYAPLRLAITHRLGEVPVGEPSVAIAAASPHRAAAYEASRRALERLKAEVPIWKREVFADGEAVWREVEPLVPPVSVPVAGSS